METRLRILADNNVIDIETFELCMQIHEKVLEPKKLVEHDAYQVLLTHLAMALQRIKSGEIANEMDATLSQEISNSDAFDDVLALTDAILGVVPFELPKSEIGYIHIHLLNLLNQERGSL